MDVRRAADKFPRPLKQDPLHPAWASFIQYCQTMKFGEIEKLVIQDGLPMVAETTRQKVKFNS